MIFYHFSKAFFSISTLFRATAGSVKNMSPSFRGNRASCKTDIREGLPRKAFLSCSTALGTILRFPLSVDLLGPKNVNRRERKL